MLLCLGLLSLDIILVNGRVAHAAGGTAGNVAAMTSWLGSRAAIAARVGDGIAGRVVRDDLAAAGVDTSTLVREDGPTCSIVHSVRSSGHSFATTCPGCARRLPKHRRLSSEHLDALADHTSRYATVFADRVDERHASWLADRASEGKAIVFEPWRRPADPVLRTMLAVSQLVKVNGTAPLVDALDAFPRRPDSVDIVTLGAEGVRWRVGGSRWRSVPGTPVDAVDAAGAGDWLTAALLAGGPPECSRHDASGFEARLRSAQIVAARSVGYIGAKGMMSPVDARNSRDRMCRSTSEGQSSAGKAEPDGCLICLRQSGRIEQKSRRARAHDAPAQ